MKERPNDRLAGYDRLREVASALRQEAHARRLASYDPLERGQDLILADEIPEPYQVLLPGGEFYDPRWPILIVRYMGETINTWQIQQDINGLHYLEATPAAAVMAEELLRSERNHLPPQLVAIADDLLGY